MKDKNLKLLNQFANDHSVSSGGNIDIKIGGSCTSYKPRGTIEKGMKLEDCNLISDLILGAQHFIWYLERNEYRIQKTRKRINKEKRSK